tara:strand:+ start:64 stop:738 length:675 start_codon:yes stop_codon:yes gene_type:complete
MKKLVIGTSFLLGSLIAPSFAEDANDFYLSVGGGVAFPSDVEGDSDVGGTKVDATFETDSTGIFSIGVGKEFNDLRFEINYSKANLESDSFKASSGGTGLVGTISPDLEINVNSYMFYGLKDFKNDTKFTPYAGIGLGIASLSADDQTLSLSGTTSQLKGASETVFSYAFKGGAAYEVAPNTSIYSEATYQNFASFKVSEAGFETVNYDSNHFFGVTAGLKFNF